MRITHGKMLELTTKMPMKQIEIPTGEYRHIGTTLLDEDTAAGVYYMPNKPYLHRYYAGTFKDGKDLWLHNFKCSDSERHLHSHPFEFETIMLCGNYTEQYRHGMEGEIITRYTSPCEWRSLDTAIERILQRLASPIKEAAPLSSIMLGLAAEHRSVGLYDWHRITHAEVDTWTAVIVDQNRLPAWFFMDDNTGDIEHRDYSPRDWWKQYGFRPVDRVIVGDNKKASK